jgi:tRNA(fMet)-specific endonuclease VapC
MIYLLDTNVCIQLLNKRHDVILQHLRQHAPTDIAVCSIVKAELLYGARRSQRVEANLQ